MTVRIVKLSTGAGQKAVQAMLDRPAYDQSAARAAERIVSAVKRRGDAAVSAFTREFDRATLGPARFKVGKAETRNASKIIGSKFRAAVKKAESRIASFARAGLRKSWSTSGSGGRAGEIFVPFDRIGAYVPGGTAPLVSTVLMTVTLAKVAGVPEIVVCTPCDRSGKIDPHLLYVMDKAGATEIYRVGGAQSIAMMAYGTKTVRKVQKIVGPGNAYVTAAKAAVYGEVALDLVAGPSEIAILADGSARPRVVAADLLSQAEHGSGRELSMLVTTSEKLARSVNGELKQQAASLARSATISKVMASGMLIVLVPSLDKGIELCNKFAPEHLELLVRNPRKLLKKVSCAGAVFVGEWTPEVVGDYIAGPSHVLPTGGAAARFSGLTVDDFRRRISVMEFSEADLRKALPVIEEFGRVEGLAAHARSAKIRFEKK